jgi:hypothetical protein
MKWKEDDIKKEKRVDMKENNIEKKMDIKEKRKRKRGKRAQHCSN